ncbi:flagellar basal-body MS-ring/collar protein FliF [Ponticaulis sp.]|uniref:flagellar basal-body MS-ring/collar protein FliF n=1 Tax=Ponticaulis sp. TaxID=2020902 RepID=UPI000B748D17|nr:flagellar basal-body MS-ring/collar protein FliF [Ponticaulis sp.]MAI89792.1 flagellar M-ring protein FliF [Ponticaulis sp.]OUX99469.1 MAG: flagellar M-ring protein FliF [Hyphomonadaceae bacterium TMED5]|tara:strand:+ start:26017 stop:27687 length:1671 start_codon:yes stop_codon:yes gene_type:complete
MAQTDEKKPGFSIAGIGQTRIIAGLIVLAIVGGALSALFLRTGSAQQALLYSGLDLSEASQIAERLDQSNIRYELRGDGSSIFVPRDSVMDARMMLSSEGLPSRGSVGYEVFDQQDALGATSFVQNVNRLRALEGELARTITSLENVRTARVHLVMPERRLFERDSSETTASIVVDIVGRTLDGAQIRAIRNLAAGAVPGLEPDHVTLLDAQGRLLAAASSEASGNIGGMSADERRAMMEQELRQKVLDQLEPVVGMGSARVQVSADVDFNRVTRSSELFDPDGRVVRSTQLVEESSADRIRGRQEATTVEQNLPDAQDTGEDGPTEDRESSRSEETINYEISRTTQTEIIEGGAINRLSIAVAIDNARVVTTAEDGTETVTFEPRSEAELAQMAALVRSAVGFDAERGDVVEVVNIQFAQPSLTMGTAASSGGLFDLTKFDIMRGVELIALLLGGLAVIFFVLRPLVSGLLAGPQKTTVRLVESGGSGVPALAGPGEENSSSSSDLEHSIDVANVSGQVKASSMRKIAEMIDQHPEESVSILRNWLNETDQRAAG